MTEMDPVVEELITADYAEAQALAAKLIDYLSAEFPGKENRPRDSIMVMALAEFLGRVIGCRCPDCSDRLAALALAVMTNSDECTRELLIEKGTPNPGCRR
jgi:hypothetical protein